MNLTIDPWLPVVWDDGRPGKVSLVEAFVRGHDIRDLSVRPHERIALMRLLICVAQAALDGPKDRADWQTCAARLPDATATYLAKWKHAFELFGDGQRFLQVANLAPVRVQSDEEGNSTSKLDAALATGNNSTLFDNAGGSTRTFPADQLAMMLLTYQNFSPCGIIGAVQWADTPIPKATGRHAPCTVGNLLHTIIRQENLLYTIGSNILTREQLKMVKQEWGVPVWENPPQSPKVAKAVSNATGTYLGRLCPLSRLVRLEPSGAAVVLGNGLAYGEWREPTATIVPRKKGGQEVRQALNGSVEKSVWRELHSIAILGKSGMDGPLALSNHDTNRSVDIWSGALVAKGNASVQDLVEAVFSLPAALFGDNGQRLYQQGVRKAEEREKRLRFAIKTYGSALGMKSGPVALAIPHYWTAVEQHVPDLLQVVEKPELLRSPDSPRDNWHQTTWGKAVLAAARSAYNLACPHETPRQMKAYALGLKALFASAAATTDQESQENTEDQNS